MRDAETPRRRTGGFERASAAASLLVCAGVALDALVRDATAGRASLLELACLSVFAVGCCLAAPRIVLQRRQ